MANTQMNNPSVGPMDRDRARAGNRSNNSNPFAALPSQKTEVPRMDIPAANPNHFKAFNSNRESFERADDGGRPFKHIVDDRKQLIDDWQQTMRTEHQPQHQPSTYRSVKVPGFGGGHGGPHGHQDSPKKSPANKLALPNMSSPDRNAIRNSSLNQHGSPGRYDQQLGRNSVDRRFKPHSNTMKAPRNPAEE